MIWHAVMEGYDSKKNVDEYWTYRELLEMIYIEDLKVIAIHKEQKRAEEKQELDNLLNNG